MLLPCAAAVADEELQPYVLPATQVHSLRSDDPAIDYEIRVWLPPGYAASQRSWPVLVMLDADYSFPLVVSIADHLMQRGQSMAYVIVAIGYANSAGNPYWYRRNRTRDYTPVHVPDGGYGAEFQKFSGGGPAFLKFIADRLLPFLAAKFRIDRADAVFVGHSYGGLFGAHVLAEEPDLFAKYVLVSPSLWYDDHRMLEPARFAALAALRDAKQVFLAVGAHENQDGRRMVDDLEQYADLLRAAGNPRLAVEQRVFDDETHASVFPLAVSAALRHFHSLATD